MACGFNYVFTSFPYNSGEHLVKKDGIMIDVFEQWRVLDTDTDRTP